MQIGEKIVMDFPENVCFGCSPTNDHGLKLVFTRTGTGSMETEFIAADHLAGMAGVVHGGIQAVLLDEVMGVTTRLSSAREDERPAATTELNLRYRKPVPTGKPIIARAEIQRVEERNIYLKAEIVDENGEVLTEAESCFRILKNYPTL